MPTAADPSLIKEGEGRRAIVSALGSRGDVNPMLAIGRALRDDGYEVVVIVAEPYVPVVQAMGFEAAVGIDSELFEATVGDPAVWHPISGPRLLLRDLVGGGLAPLYRLIEELYRPGRTILIAHPLDLAARIFRDSHPETRLISVHLAPATFRNPSDPPQMTTGLLNFRRPEIAVRGAYWIVDRTLLRRWIEGPLNRFRATLGLAPVFRPMRDWWYSPDCVLALYPPWFAPGHLPPNWHTVGFPLFDGPESEMPDSQSVADSPDPNEPQPWVFTAGSAHIFGQRFFREAIRFCRDFNLHGILLTSRPEQIPENLPASIRRCGYVPLGHLLNSAAGIVHHGGIGTTSQALMAGVPQIICPMAFDQFDNGRRITQLGRGVMLPMKKMNADRIASAYAALAKLPPLSKIPAVDKPSAEKELCNPNRDEFDRRIRMHTNGLWNRPSDLTNRSP
jgi:rhamnosyltransferase subunit B